MIYSCHQPVHRGFVDRCKTVPEKWFCGITTLPIPSSAVALTFAPLRFIPRSPFSLRGKRWGPFWQFDVSAQLDVVNSGIWCVQNRTCCKTGDNSSAFSWVPLLGGRSCCSHIPSRTKYVVIYQHPFIGSRECL